MRWLTRRTNGQRENEVPVRYLLRDAASRKQLKGKVRLAGRFNGAETAAGWIAIFSNSIVILFMATTMKLRHFVFSASEMFFQPYL